MQLRIAKVWLESLSEGADVLMKGNGIWKCQLHNVIVLSIALFILSPQLPPLFWWGLARFSVAAGMI